MKSLWILLLACLLAPFFAQAQKDHRYGTLSGSFETNSIYYRKDSKLGDIQPIDHFGSNNYVKFDYRIGPFQAGLAYEAYLPVLQGFPGQLKNSDIVFKYVTFEDFNLSITGGDFYEQYGSGLIFRAYEERALGLNTSVEGVRGEYHFGEYVRLKGMWGRPRKFMEHSDSKVRGADISLSLSKILGSDAMDLFMEGSYFNRYQSYTGPEEIDPNVDAWSGRLALDYQGFSLKGEYVEKGKDPAVYNNNSNEKANALLAEIGYVRGGFGALATFRRLENMRFASEREPAPIGQDLNYIPALTRQYTYMLANLNPYTAQVAGEIGGQADLYYNFKRGTALGGKYGMKVAANFSCYYNLAGNAIDGFDFGFGKTMLFRDINIDIVKKWNRHFKMVFEYSMQSFNPLVTGHDSDQWDSHIVVADLAWNFTDVNSLRMELQHLLTKQDQKNWAAALLEFNMAPRWSIFASDMWNYGDTDIHYYNSGVSYTRSRTRIALNYGRNRAGYTCAGGICRATPAYTGFNLQLTTSF